MGVNMRKRFLIVLLAILIISIIAVSCSSNNADKHGDAYDFTLQDTQGNTHTLSDYHGSKVYLKIWATWCPSCIKGLDELDELAKQADEKDIVVLTLVAPNYSGEKSSEGFIEWYEKQNNAAKVLLDEGGKVFREYEISIAPTSFFIDKKGNIYKKIQSDVKNERIYEIFDSMD